MNTLKHERIAWRAIAAGYAASAASAEESTSYAATLRRSLAAAELRTPGERSELYEAVIEGTPTAVADPETAFGPTAFEALVQGARAYGWFAVDAHVLGRARQLSVAAGFCFEDAFELMRVVTRECRRRYAPHRRPPAEPPEPVETRDPSVEHLGEIALRFFR